MRLPTPHGAAALLSTALLLATLTPAQASEELADKHACLNCHQVQKKLVGPAFKAVADKYRGQPQAAEQLLLKLAKGGSGVWGAVPMPAMALPPDDARAVIDWILKLP